MADLPMAQIPNFQLGATPNPNAFSSAMAQTGQVMNQTAQNFTAMAAQRQQAATQAAQLQQQQHQDQVSDALQLLATTGAQLQYLRPDAQKLAISNSLNSLAKVAPEFGITPHTPDQLPDESVDLMKSYAKLHEGYMKGDVSLPTFQTQGQMILGEMSQYERNMTKENSNILGEPKVEPGQINGQSVNFNPETGQSSAQGTGQTVPGNFIPNTTIAREQNTRQIAAAGAATPYTSQLASFHTIDSALSRGDQIGDRTAVLEAGKFLGETPEQMQKLAKSGFFGENLVQYAEKGFGTADMTPTQRNDFRSIMQLHMQGLQKASAVQTQMYPGATGPNLDTPQQPIIRKLKSGRNAVSVDGGKSWQPMP